MSSLCDPPLKNPGYAPEFTFETTRCHHKEAFFQISSYSREYEYFIYKETNKKVPWERYQTEINNEQTESKLRQKALHMRNG